MSEVFYYYLRDEENQPYGCVAIQETHDGKINRGVSICSTRDHFDKNHARGLASARLKQAEESLLGSPFGSYRGKHPTIPAGVPFQKFDCNVNPTDYEYRILHKPE